MTSRMDRNGLASSILSTRKVVAFVLALGLFGAIRNIVDMQQISLAIIEAEVSDGPTKQTTKTTVAYAVTVTHFKLEEVKDSESKHIDRAAVLHQSIKLAMQKSEKYDYHIFAFVHQDAKDAQPFLERLGYRVQIKDTPFNISEVENTDLVGAQHVGCCGEKEYLKLYSWLLLDYPVVVHLDLDTIVLRPMEEVFDFMTLTQTIPTTNSTRDQVEAFAQSSSMWLNKNFDIEKTHATRKILNHPEKINLMYTRDYNMVDPPLLQPYQMGVQGGFMIIRPNQHDFDRMVEIIKSGGGFKNAKWGFEEIGEAGYGGYYGAATIQGLASYYYDYYGSGLTALELNRCNYNSMADNPMFHNQNSQKDVCRTTEDQCEDCRDANIEDIYTAHFTVCGKPEWCHPPANRLCGELMHEWYKTRLSLERDWMQRFSAQPYIPHLKPNKDTNKNLGHCDGPNYLPLSLPELMSLQDFTSSFI